MPQLEPDKLYIHRTVINQRQYTSGQKILDFMSLVSAPSLSRSTSAYNKIQRRLENDNRLNERLSKLKLNTYDEHLFNASQMNKGILNKETLVQYAKENFKSREARDSFLQYTRFRLGHLASLGLLNDVSTSKEFYNEKVVMEGEDGQKEFTVSIKKNYRYEVNERFYRYLQEFRKQKAIELKDKFEFGRFDAYIYNRLKESGGHMDLEGIKQEKTKQAAEEAQKVLHQVKLMYEIGHLHQKQPGIFSFNEDFKQKIKNNSVYLNAGEKKVVDFIQRHGVFSKEKYNIDLKVEAEGYADIIKNRLDKLVKVGFVENREKGIYHFTNDGEERLKGYYAESYGFTSFDQNILSNHSDGVIQLEDVRKELENRYGEESAQQSLERQKERLFIMECAGIVNRDAPEVYTLTEKGRYILDEENRILTEEKRELLKQTFKYSEDDELLFEMIKEQGGSMDIKAEIEKITGSLGSNGMKEFSAYNAVMRNYKSLGTTDIDVNDEVKQNVKLGYIVENEDGTLSLTVRGKLLVNAINNNDNLKLKAARNKKRLQ